MRISAIITILIVILLLPFSGVFGQKWYKAFPQESNPKYGIRDHWGVGAKASTDGIGLEAVKSISSRLNIRLGFSRLRIPYTLDTTLQGITLRAEADLKFRGINLTADYYLVKNWLHLSAGIMQNGQKYSVKVTPLSPFPYGDVDIPATELGTVEAIITPGIIFSPYVGLGFGNTLPVKHRFSFNFEIGTLYHGAPKFDLLATNMLSPMASENNIKAINSALAQFRWYPMVCFQVNYRIL